VETLRKERGRTGGDGGVRGEGRVGECAGEMKRGAGRGGPT